MPNRVSLIVSERRLFPGHLYHTYSSSAELDLVSWQASILSQADIKRPGREEILLGPGRG